ncbi:hypothetical protein JTB14_025678 [Gonioctena quinquepunctata]|nr:hypothetical protein JTB14_025678 [Gonioctena quinquepunctata]
MIKRQTGNNIKSVSRDNEIVSRKKESIMKQVPRIPEQNGKAKQDLRSIVESARSMLTHSGLPINLWAEATNMTVYLLNRRLCKPDDLKTPYETRIGKQPDLRHLRTFGSATFVLVSKHIRHKFGRKSTKHFSVAREVTFNEGVFMK